MRDERTRVHMDGISKLRSVDSLLQKMPPSLFLILTVCVRVCMINSEITFLELFLILFTLLFSKLMCNFIYNFCLADTTF